MSLRISLTKHCPQGLSAQRCCLGPSSTTALKVSTTSSYRTTMSNSSTACSPATSARKQCRRFKPRGATLFFEIIEGMLKAGDRPEAANEVIDGFWREVWWTFAKTSKQTIDYLLRSKTTSLVHTEAFKLSQNDPTTKISPVSAVPVPAHPNIRSAHPIRPGDRNAGTSRRPTSPIHRER